MKSHSAQIHPLSKFKVFQSQHLDEVREVMAQIYCEHTIDYARPSQQVSLEVSEVRLPHSAIIVGSYAAWVNVTVNDPSNFAACQFLLSGNNTFNIGKETLNCEGQMGVFLSPAKPFSINQNPSSQVLGFRVDPFALQRNLESLLMAPISQPLEFEARMDLSGETGFLYRYLRFFMHELEERHHLVLQSPVALANFEQTMIDTLLMTQPHNYTTSLLNPLPATPQQVTEVEEYLEAHADQPTDMTLLAMELGYSLSSIYKAFKKFRGYTPMQFLKRIRLENVRKDLVKASSSRSVFKIAMDRGFTHPGHFSVDYKRQFGESPSEKFRQKKR
jgi:AraC-like DNA-binding protein